MNQTPGQIIERLKENHERFKSNLAAVRGNGDLSDSAKRRELAAAYEDARNTYDDLAKEYREAVRQRVEERRSRVFAPPKLEVDDKALGMFIYRDALREAGGVREPEKLRDMLERAAVVGDTPMARACLYRAYETGASSVVGSYFEKYPDELAAWNSFMDAAEQSNKLEQLGMDFSTGIPEPQRPQEAAYANSIPSYPPN